MKTYCKCPDDSGSCEYCLEYYLKKEYKMKIHIDKVKGYSFKGHVLIEDLSLELRDVLRITNSDEHITQVEVHGDFTVYTNGSDEAYIDSIDLSLWNMGHFVDLKDTDYDDNDIAEQIEDMSDPYEWVTDHNIAYGDYLHDYWKENGE